MASRTMTDVMRDTRIPRRSLLIAMACAAAVAASAPAAWRYLGTRTVPRIARIRLQPFGDLPEADVDLIGGMLSGVFAMPVDRMPALALPHDAFYPPRNRYRADRLLEHLGSRDASAGTLILGVTGVDISATKGDVPDWGVLGLALAPGTCGIVSSFRCRTGARDAAHVRERCAKVAVHEAGHCMGLHHCPQPRCILRDAEARIATIDEARGLCPACRARLQAWGIRASEGLGLPERRATA